MSSNILDSSAVLAVLHQERGSERAITFFPGGVISSINAAEVLTKSIEKGHGIKTALRALELLQLEIVDFDIEQASKAAELRPLTRHLGLSLGDRSCLALAILRNGTVVTADKDWKKVSVCPIELIR